MKRAICLILAMALFLTGCTMAPKYTRPGLPVPGNWPENPVTAPAASAGAAVLSSPATGAMPASPSAEETPWREYFWREHFTDPQLKSIIELALSNNRDLRVAILTVEKAQALYRIQRSDLYPSVGIMASGEKYRVPEKMADGGKAYDVETDSVQVGTLSWERDLFGRVRSLKDKALNQYLATDQARWAAQISLVAAVANSFLLLSADRENLQLAQRTLDTQRKAYELIARSREVGIASDLDLNQAQSQVEVARVDMARYTGLVAADENLLNLLAGTAIPPRMLPRDLGSAGGVKELSPGLPSEVLLRRPDILAAEFQLKAANANIGAARAAFFPRITLTAGIGTMSNELSGLFDSGTRTWTFAPSIVAPIFASGGLRANLKAAKVDRDIAVAQYERSIQNAFREVSDGLALRATLAEQQDAQEALVGALDRAYFLSEARYREGIDGYLGVLVAQRALYVAQQGLVQVRLARQANQVTLYKALGGGA